jgi:hypothetical protein
MNRVWNRLGAISSLALACLVGCGDGLTVVPVQGTVLHDGQPLPNAHVTFQPVGDASDRVGPGSYGVTDGQGRYELKLTTDDRPGAVVGEHRVRVVTNTQSDPDSDLSVNTGVALPSEFLDGSYTMTVPPEGSEQLDISIPK